jgi:hypothetical protein
MSDNTYIKINEIYNRLKAAMEHYFRKRQVYRLSGLEGKLEALTPVAEIQEPVIVIDDLLWITDAPSQQYAPVAVRRIFVGQIDDGG